MARTLPRFIVLKSNKEKVYMGFVHENTEFDMYLKFMETQAVSPYAKFEVKVSREEGLVHIKSCQNNKYWVRTKNPSIIGSSTEHYYWIAAIASKPEEDKSKETCTLFQPISVDPAPTTVRFIHVQSGCYLYAQQSYIPQYTGLVLANEANVTYDYRGCYLFTVIDWESLLILPRYVAFKGDNDKFLCLRRIRSDPYLQFKADDIGDVTVTCEIFVVDDGNVRIKSICTNKFWRRSLNGILADSDDTSSDNKDTLFRPVKVDDKTIALVNLGNNCFCGRHTSGGKTSRLDAVYCFCGRHTSRGKTSRLDAAFPSAVREACLIVEEPIMTRNIYNVKYNLDYSRVYDERVLLVAKNSTDNRTKKSTSLDVKLSYTDTKTRTWKTMCSLKLGIKTALEVRIPFISNGKIELSGELQNGVEWEKIMTSNTVLQVGESVDVPPKTKVTVNLMATSGMCDVPFTFMQTDTLYNGIKITPEMKYGTYTGTNYYNIHFKIEKEKLNSKGLLEWFCIKRSGFPKVD